MPISITKPTVGGDADAWGAKVNTALDVVVGGVNANETSIAAKAPLASPVFTGNPTAPTPTAGDNDTSVATTAFVTTAVASTSVVHGDATIQTIVQMTQAAYDALGTKVSTTMYVIVG